MKYLPKLLLTGKKQQCIHLKFIYRIDKWTKMFEEY